MEIVGLTLEETIRVRRKSEQPNELQTSPNITRMNRTMRMRWRGHVACMKIKELSIKFICEYLMQKRSRGRLERGRGIV